MYFHSYSISNSSPWIKFVSMLIHVRNLISVNFQTNELSYRKRVIDTNNPLAERLWRYEIYVIVRIMDPFHFERYESLKDTWFYVKQY